MTKIAINGFGRIGRLAFRLISEIEEIEVVAINDLTDAETLAYLLKYDTAQGNFKMDGISNTEDSLLIDGKQIRIYAQKDPELLPWKELGIDIVIECTGRFTSQEKASKHITAGAKKVIISAPASGDVKTIVYNVNHEDLDGSETIISAASCTTNCLAPVVKVLNDNFGLVKGYMTTVHAYTNDQRILDLPHPKGIYSRRGRAAAVNIVPTSTGAAVAVGKVLPELKGRLDGIALRVPTITGSVVDLIVELKKNTTAEEINKKIKENSNETLGYTEDPIVSSDIVGCRYGSYFDALSTNIMDVDGEQLIKILAWYDNEMSYTAQLVRTTQYIAKFI
ncbi:type I glyceraldehyde-3-phosphate dehydrogenase [Sedimentibacter sp. zth1]|uniref:type I glyceraldehyde-3-phosphate dehydrogenase n=1 Tax=Sedimentibacter sp. zth1 TaxID=2816908 RepID=UPI001A924D86|nr:type I glyceraldehyde-3-phosphate dehydrogenase [Sedimentibacter sp. zth1]QSX06236.1 type I glyceraldehyde-3-phosphate dehydrogenase [Sedimentibacter sp. zth1]